MFSATIIEGESHGNRFVERQRPRAIPPVMSLALESALSSSDYGDLQKAISVSIFSAAPEISGEPIECNENAVDLDQ